jgi:hypothetical protein
MLALSNQIRCVVKLRGGDMRATFKLLDRKQSCQ